MHRSVCSEQWGDFTGNFVVFTTFLILFGSGMVVTNVVWYWYEFDCLIPEGSRDMGSYGEDMGSCDRERSSLLIFASRGSAPR